MEALEEYIEGVYNGLLKESRKPSVLYQYTDITALQGIVENNELWATHYRFLNDKKEFDHGLRLAVAYAKEKNKKAKFKVKSFLKKLSNIYDQADNDNVLPFNDMDVYSISFSTEPDLLSQWRGYGKKYKSVCIGIKEKELMAGADEGEWYVFLRRAIYDPKIQETVIHEYLDKVCEIMENNSSDFNGKNNPYLESFRYRFNMGLIMFALCFKEECWKEENEWRLIALHYKEKVKDSYKVFFKENDYGLVPYIKIPVSKDKKALNVISKIILPKSENYIRSKKALAMYFSQKDKSADVSIEESQISIVY